MDRKQPIRSRAFTLIEVLVVIVTIGVLAGLLLPAVQSVRERARATSCMNNMVSVHLAIESYQTSFNVYPAGTVTDRLPARMFPDGKDHSWLVQVRPFMDGGFAFSGKWSSVDSAYHPTNWILTQAGPAHLACPSSPVTHQSGVIPLSYVGIHDGVDMPIDTNSLGFFVANRFLRRKEIVDGLSNTLQLGEIRVDADDTFFWTAGNQSTLRTTGLPMQTRRMGRWRNEDRLSYAYGLFADPPTIDYAMIANQFVDDDGTNRDAIATAISDLAMVQTEAGTDSQLSAEFGSRPATAQWAGSHSEPAPPGFTIPHVEPSASRPRPLGSSHGSMINAVFADGRVTTINQSIDQKLFMQIGIRDDRLPLAIPNADWD